MVVHFFLCHSVYKHKLQGTHRVQASINTDHIMHLCVMIFLMQKKSFVSHVQIQFLTDC